MANPQKAKGTRWESDVTALLREAGLKVYKPRQEGFRDVGDVHAPPFVLQAKAYRDLVAGLREGLSGAVVQVEHAGEGFEYGAAVVKRPRAATGEGYFVLRLDDAARLMRRLREAEESLAAWRRCFPDDRREIEQE